jgi:hypothetical protein
MADFQKTSAATNQVWDFKPQIRKYGNHQKSPLLAKKGQVK